MVSIKGTVKATKGGKVAIDARVSDLPKYAKQYVGDTVDVGGVAMTITGVGSPFVADGATRIYLYTDAVSTPTPTPTRDSAPCRKCGTWCYGDCSAR